MGLTEAQFPGAILMPADPSNYRAGRPAPPSEITIHITSGHADPRGTAAMWQHPVHPPTTAHFVVGQDGTIVQSVACEDTAWHAHDASLHAIGIEHSARQPGEPGWPKGDPGMPPTAELYQASAELVAHLCCAYGIVPERHVTIKGHAEADPKTTHTDCPDKAPWDWDRYMALVLEAYSSSGGGSTPAAPANADSAGSMSDPAAT